MIREYKEKKEGYFYLNFKLIIPNKYFISRLVNDKEFYFLDSGFILTHIIY